MPDNVTCYMCGKKMEKLELNYKRFEIQNISSKEKKTLAAGYICSQDCYLMFLATNYWLLMPDRERVKQTLVENHGFGWVWVEKALDSIVKNIDTLQSKMLEEKSRRMEH